MARASGDTILEPLAPKGLSGFQFVDRRQTLAGLESPPGLLLGRPAEVLWRSLAVKLLALPQSCQTREALARFPIAPGPS